MGIWDAALLPTKATYSKRSDFDAISDGTKRKTDDAIDRNNEDVSIPRISCLAGCNFQCLGAKAFLATKISTLTSRESERVFREMKSAGKWRQRKLAAGISCLMYVIDLLSFYDFSLAGFSFLRFLPTSLKICLLVC